ncbi:pentapeptide repeat-containing protein [Alicyclobacillus mengziensis]|uniref:Pentapeptide repeat-containing protein n=1 Tax=Alicyclobacillus mengziensis TaxID=2931921 RepID=A0A9X7VZJ7_9BACL|nr:pentapeptide repeat-containing protein [Alicyclobacillus mengziensis]
MDRVSWFKRWSYLEQSDLEQSNLEQSNLEQSNLEKTLIRTCFNAV